MNERSQVQFADVAGDLLDEQGWSQVDIARKLDLDPAFLSKALRGKDYKRLSPDLIARISVLAGLDEDHFPEVREARLIALIRSRPGLRDHLYDEFVVGGGAD